MTYLTFKRIIIFIKITNWQCGYGVYAFRECFPVAAFRCLVYHFLCKTINVYLTKPNKSNRRMHASASSSPTQSLIYFSKLYLKSAL